MSETNPRETLHRLAREDPLASPLVASVALFNYEQAPPEHVRKLYGDVRRALDPAYQQPKKLLKLMPREHAKSESGTVVVPTWLALKDPNTRILIMSETETQAKGKLDEVTEHVERLAPPFGRKIDSNSATELQLEREQTYDVPTVKAAGFNTGVTGGHYDLLIFDDLVSYESQRTPARREKTWSMFQDYLNLGSEGESTYLVLGTRKHPEDLYNRLLEAPAWRSNVERAIQDWSIIENGEYHVTVEDDETGREWQCAADEIGEIDGRNETIVEVHPHREVPVLWPERWPLKALIDDMLSGFGEDESTLVWQRENQNNPDVFQGEILSEDMLTFASEADVPDSVTYYAGLDLGVEDDPEKAAKNDTDYWALAILAYHRASDMVYVADLQRKRGMSLKKGISWAAQKTAGYDLSRFLVESNQAQRWFVQSARDEGLRVEETSSSGSKEERIISMSSRFESGRVKLVEEAMADGWESFVSEWCAFPSGAHDDRLDALEIAMRNLGMGGGPTGSVGSMSDLLG